MLISLNWKIIFYSLHLHTKLTDIQTELVMLQFDIFLQWTNEGIWVQFSFSLGNAIFLQFLLTCNFLYLKTRAMFDIPFELIWKPKPMPLKYQRKETKVSISCKYVSH